MIKKGIYKDEKVHSKDTNTSYDVDNPLEWWPNSRQEVDFEIINGRASIKKLGKIYKESEINDFINNND